MTVLIIGGAYQGKRKVAENLYADCLLYKSDAADDV